MLQKSMSSNARLHKDKITQKVMIWFFSVIANTWSKMHGLDKVQTISQGAFCISVYYNSVWLSEQGHLSPNFKPRWWSYTDNIAKQKQLDCGTYFTNAFFTLRHYLRTFCWRSGLNNFILNHHTKHRSVARRDIFNSIKVIVWKTKSITFLTEAL